MNFSFSSIFCNLLWRKFWNHLQAEIIPWSPMFLDFLPVLHMVWKSQENCEPWLVGFWVSRHSKMPKISVNIFFPFLSSYYGFNNCCGIIENCKIQFFNLFGLLFFNFALKTYGTLKMFLLSAQNNFYIILSSYVEGHV